MLMFYLLGSLELVGKSSFYSGGAGHGQLGSAQSSAVGPALKYRLDRWLRSDRSGGRSDRQWDLAKIPLRTRKGPLWTIRISVGQTGLEGGRTGLAGLTGSSMLV